MVTITISPALSPDRKKETLDVQGTTVGEVLERHTDENGPQLKRKILDEDGEINQYINVYLNGHEVSTLDGLATSVSAEDEMRIIPALSGGSH